MMVGSSAEMHSWNSLILLSFTCEGGVRCRRSQPSLNICSLSNSTASPTDRTGNPVNRGPVAKDSMPKHPDEAYRHILLRMPCYNRGDPDIVIPKLCTLLQSDLLQLVCVLGSNSVLA